MRYYKMVINEYIEAIGKGQGGTEISANEYNEILDIIANAPEVQEGYIGKLRTDKTWEICELEPMPEDGEIPDEIALDIITGVSE